MRRLVLVGVLALLAAGCGAVPATPTEDPLGPGVVGASQRAVQPQTRSQTQSQAPAAAPMAPLPAAASADPRAREAAKPVPTSVDRLVIGSLGISARIRSVRFVGSQLQIPASVGEVGLWREGAALSDAVGTTVMVGHVSDNRDRPGVLARLKKIRSGAEIRVRFRGRVHRFEVQRVRSYSKARLPRSVFRQTGRHRLVLITCSRKVVYPNGGFHYAENLVVTASPR